MKNLAFDLHGVLDKYMIHDILLKLSKKYKIYILSGAPSVEIKETLDYLKYSHLHYHHILSIVDYVKDEIKLPCYQKISPRTGKLNWYCDEGLWWAMKSIICDINKIDILFDDKLMYGKYFGKNHKTKFYLIDEILSDTTIVYQEICDKL